MIDEVDKSLGSMFFLDFLGTLRAKYLARNNGAINIQKYNFNRSKRCFSFKIADKIR